MGLRGFLAGVLGLSALYALVGTREGPDRAAGLVGVVEALTRAFLDPSRPAIPDFRQPRTPLVVDSGSTAAAGSTALYAAYTQPPARSATNFAL